MQLVLRRRLRMPLPLCHGRPPRRPRARLPANRPARPTCQGRRASVGPRRAREAVGAEGQVVPQPPGVRTEDKRRLDVVIYGATPNGSALCCDAALVSPLTRTGQPQPCTAGRLPGAPAPRAAEAPGAWQRGRRALQRRHAATGARPGPTAVPQSAASPARHCVFRLDASLVRHAVCLSPQALPLAAMAPTAAGHQRCGSAA